MIEEETISIHKLQSYYQKKRVWIVNIIIVRAKVM